MKRINLSKAIVAIVSIFLCTSLVSPVSAEGNVDLSIRKNVGTNLGNKIEGTFTISGSGSESIVNLTLYFNDTQVAFSESNALTFKFDTNNYDLGFYTITLVGMDATGQSFEDTLEQEFISPEVGGWIGGLAIGIAIISLIFSFMKKKKANKPTDVSEIKIGDI